MTYRPARHGAADDGGHDADPLHMTGGRPGTAAANGRSAPRRSRGSASSASTGIGRWGAARAGGTGQAGRPALAAEQAVTDALEAVGQDVQQKRRRNSSASRHHLLAVMMPVVLPAEGNAAVLDPDQSAAGNGDPVGVAAEIFEHLLRPPNGGLA